MRARHRGHRLLGTMGASLGALACMRLPSLPPPQTLQSGCHVWYDHQASGRGVAVGVLEYTSFYYGHDGQTADGPTLAADGSMWFRNTRFAQFDGKLLVLEEIRLFQGHYRGEVREAPVEWIELTGDSAPAFMQVSTACSRREAALGAAAVFIVLSTE